jgi:hypothetical protein
MGVFALVLGLAGCNVRHDGDAVTRQFGSDYFGAGGAMNLTDSVAGDAFLAGGHVTTASDVRGDLVVAGGEVSIGGAVGDDLYAAGGEVQLDAIVSGNARVAGGNLTVGPATVVHGALSLSGGWIRFDGMTHDSLKARGGEVEIDGTVLGVKLRLVADILLDAAAAAGHPARTLVVKVVPTFSISPESVVGKPLSEVVRESLRTTAQSVKDPDLRAQLLKLASLP